MKRLLTFHALLAICLLLPAGAPLLLQPVLFAAGESDPKPPKTPEPKKKPDDPRGWFVTFSSENNRHNNQNR